MGIEVDQSGKIEATSRLAVLAFSNDKSGAVLLSAKDKRRLQERFRKIGTSRKVTAEQVWKLAKKITSGYLKAGL